MEGDDVHVQQWPFVFGTKYLVVFEGVYLICEGVYLAFVTRLF